MKRVDVTPDAIITCLDKLWAVVKEVAEMAIAEAPLTDDPGTPHDFFEEIESLKLQVETLKTPSRELMRSAHVHL